MAAGSLCLHRDILVAVLAVIQALVCYSWAMLALCACLAALENSCSMKLLVHASFTVICLDIPFMWQVSSASIGWDRECLILGHPLAYHIAIW